MADSDPPETLRTGVPNVIVPRREPWKAVTAFGGLALWLLLFTRLHAATARDAAAATANARTLQSVERALHLDVERPVNQWLAGHPALIQPAVYNYRLYYAVVLGVLVWVYVRHADAFVRVRRALVAMTVLVLPVYWAVPMSPPRFALPGAVDIVAEHDLFGHRAATDIGDGRTSFTAMPSMHVAWSAWCAYAVWSVLRATHPRLALLAWVFPLVMTADVFATGNHYVLDVAGSAVLVGAAIATAALWGRIRYRWSDRRRRDNRSPQPLRPDRIDWRE